MSNDMQRKILIAILVALVGLGLWWFYFYLEWKTTEVNLGYGKEASKNNYLAAQLFLESQNIPSEYSIQLNKLDNIYDKDGQLATDGELSLSDTLVIINGRGVFNGRRFESVFKWVEEGGHLIATVENPFLSGSEYSDALFDELGIYFDEEAESDFFSDVFGRHENYDEYPYDEHSYEEEASEDEISKQELVEDDNENAIIEDASLEKEKTEDEWEWVDSNRCGEEATSELTLHDSREVLEIDIRWGRRFFYQNYHADWEALHYREDETDILGASFPVGNGRISIVSDAQFLENRNIQCHDHAYLLWRLANPEGKVWVLENLDAPSLFSISLRHLPYASLAVLLAVILSVWSWLTRFGPVFIVKKIERRSFAEHIRANAMFMWRKSQYVALINPLRRSVEKQMARRVYGFDRLSNQEKVEHVTEHTQVPPQFVEPALFKLEIETLNEFVEFVRTLKHIKDQL